VSLKITNASGDVIAYKPKFAAFHKDHDDSKGIVVNGEFKLKNPDIYFLSFRVRDHYSKNFIQHDEKIIVKLP